jgi:methylated-DNA-[protein]-cysteine S-methyltransferase
VGQALKVNPFAPQVPCHRVITASLTLGGFQGEREGAAIERKRRLLAREGVQFKAGKLVEPDRVFAFTRSHHEA